MATKNKTFEQAMEELEEIVESLEKGNLSLDESLKAFEKGIHSIRLCNEKLMDAEQKVKILLQNEDGTLQENDFSTNL